MLWGSLHGQHSLNEQNLGSERKTDACGPDAAATFAAHPAASVQQQLLCRIRDANPQNPAQMQREEPPALCRGQAQLWEAALQPVPLPWVTPGVQQECPFLRAN